MPPALTDHTACPGPYMTLSSDLCSVIAEVGGPQISSANRKSANLQPYFFIKINT
jgi:hypothetical protein